MRLRRTIPVATTPYRCANLPKYNAASCWLLNKDWVNGIRKYLPAGVAVWMSGKGKSVACAVNIKRLAECVISTVVKNQRTHCAVAIIFNFTDEQHVIADDLLRHEAALEARSAPRNRGTELGPERHVTFSKRSSMGLPVMTNLLHNQNDSDWYC